MKKINLNKKLQLNKENVAKLNKTEMNNVNGGAQGTLTFPVHCSDHCTETDICCSLTIARSCFPKD